MHNSQSNSPQQCGSYLTSETVIPSLDCSAILSACCREVVAINDLQRAIISYTELPCTTDIEDRGQNRSTERIAVTPHSLWNCSRSIHRPWRVPGRRGTRGDHTGSHGYFTQWARIEHGAIPSCTRGPRRRPEVSRSPVPRHREQRSFPSPSQFGHCWVFSTPF